MVDARVLVHDLLVKIHGAETPQAERRKAEDSLKSLSQFTVQHVRDLCDIIASSEIALDSKLETPVPC